MNIKIAQVVGLNTDQKAAQVSSATREDNTFLAVLEIASDDAFTKGRQILSELEDFYFESEGTISEKLKAAFDEAKNKTGEGVDFSLSLATISGKVLYLIGKGQVEVYLKRGDKLSPLLSVAAQEQLISGFIASGDRLLLTTNSLSGFLGSELDKSLSLPIENFEEEVGSKIEELTASEKKVPEGEEVKDESLPKVQGLAALTIEAVDEDVEISSLPATEEKKEEEQQIMDEQERATRPSFNVSAVLSKIAKAVSRVKIYIPQSGRGRAIVAVILIIIILLGAGYQYKLSLDRKVQAQFNQTLQEAKDDFNGAKGLASLNPNEAKTKLDLSLEKVKKALLLQPKSTEAQSLKDQIEKETPSILQQSSISDFPVFLDMDLVKKNFRATQLSLSGSKLLLLDPTVKTLVVVDLAKKSNQILAGSEQLGEAVFASLNGNFAFVYSKDKGVLRIDTSNQKIAVVSKKDSDLGGVKDIYGFASNVYLLDPTGNMIWKYLPASDSYSDKREYFSTDTKADLSSALRLQIESSIYVLKSGGEVLRFTKGVKDNFSFSGLPSGVKDPKSLFVSSDTDNLYLLDSGNSRLLTLTKTGGYKSQMSGGKFAAATDLAVDEVGKKVYLLDGGKIYSVDLK
ncbi:hypothetical protein HY383_02005 [Candidatus Daviesbacteria bacterium]|nr:hypothetical protein [Candidatus Daviesbacteria bacterium]